MVEVLEKYGCVEKLGIDNKKTFDSLVEINDMRDIYEAKNKADKLWENLPIEVRQEFNNNANEFMKNGEKWLKERIAKEEALRIAKEEALNPQPETKQTNTTDKGE